MLIAGIALFNPSTPHIVIAAYLFAFGVLRSAQMVSMGALAYSEVQQEDMSKATSIFALVQRFSQSLGVGVSASLLAALSNGGPITVNDFRIVFIFIALLIASSAIGFARLRPTDGAQVSGYQPRRAGALTEEPAAATQPLSTR
jgi:hypothetical protein